MYKSVHYPGGSKHAVLLWAGIILVGVLILSSFMSGVKKPTVKAAAQEVGKIAFVASSPYLGGEDSEIYIVDADGSNRRPLTDNDTNEESPVWSSGGRQTNDDALQRAIAGVTSNSQWQGWYPQGVVQEFQGIPFVLVPAGCFVMGNDNPLRDSPPGPKPAHQQCFDEPFWISQTELTQADFKRLGGVKQYHDEPSGDRLPVHYISWAEARELVEKNGFRLPTEREWEYAARGPDGLFFPWGNEFIPDHVVFRENSTGVAEVGSRPGGASWVGALDMSGNVDEWVSSRPDAYPYMTTDRREDSGEGDIVNYRGLRGGSWLWGISDYLRTDQRSYSGGTDYFGERGVRLAMSFTPETALITAPAEAETPDLIATAVAGTVAAIQPPTATPTPDIVATAVAATITAMQLPPAGSGGKIAFVSNRNDGDSEIYIMDADGSNQHNLSNNDTSDEHPVWSPDGSQIAFYSNTEIYVISADGSNQRNLTANDAYNSGYVWSPDGSRIVFASDLTGSDEIYVMNADGSNLANLTNTDAREGDPTWSPDGSQIAFISERDGNWEIYVMNADGSSPRRLTQSDVIDQSPVWSPDGRQIAFESDGEIYVMNADGSNLTNLTNHDEDDEHPVWSPDGRQIAFVSRRDGKDAIYVMNADGSSPRRLTNNDSYNEDPVWSPDGSQIAFVSGSEIYVMNADGSNPRNLTQNDFDDHDPAWQP